MNGSTVKSLLKCGYSLGSKDFLVYTNTTRFLYNYTADKRYCSSWSMQPNPQYKLCLSPVRIEQLFVNNKSLIPLNHRCFSTTQPQNGQTALKAKTAERNDGNKLVKERKKPAPGEKTETPAKTETEIEKDVDKSESMPQSDEKLTLTAKFKKMYKEYWYVLLPVHVVTSTFWLGGFYYLSTSGVDIPTVLESMHFSETMIAKLRDSSLGHAAVAYLCYKIATPFRYTVTLGGSTVAIRYLSKWGYIRPVPSKEKLKQMYDDQKAKFQMKD